MSQNDPQKQIQFKRMRLLIENEVGCLRDLIFVYVIGGGKIKSGNIRPRGVGM
jgi:hypothetical protein